MSQRFPMPRLPPLLCHTQQYSCYEHEHEPIQGNLFFMYSMGNVTSGIQYNPVTMVGHGVLKFVVLLYTVCISVVNVLTLCGEQRDSSPPVRFYTHCCKVN